ncbi:MAG: hypothetical protein H6739_01760 [Alphaproteobacteria bacterium]|nr:hypothetical protein [Alphaproteobacteria bacterium]
MIVLLALLSCGPVDLQEAPPAPTMLDGPRLARRLSLELRGTLPTVEELDAAAASEDGWRTLRDAWLEDPRLEDRLVELLGQRWHTRVDTFDIEAFDYGLDPIEEYRFERSVGEEPLRLMAYVATQDLPWPEIVTADYTRANDLLADIWPLSYPADAEGWQVARYTDGRPAAGVLATNGLWWRYNTNESNMNRARAAAISRLLLCEDFLARPVSFASDDRSLSGDPELAVRTDPYCLACHASIDPLAASMFGFWWLSLYSVVEETAYHPEREPLAEEVLGTSPAWFGEPIAGLADLGVHVANDSRFLTCTVSSTAELLWQRPVTLADQGTLDALTATFVDEGWRMKPLLAAITETEAYRAGDAWDLAEARGVRMLTPGQLASALEDLTGFRWVQEGYDQLDNDTLGFRVLAGGVDGVSVLRPADQPGLTWALVARRAAQGAAVHAVTHKLPLAPDPQGLFRHVDPGSRAGDPAFDDELRDLHWRLYAEPAEDAWLAAVRELWLAVEAVEGPQGAWTATLSALLRDPRFLTR